jgi:hypothetical protein
LVSWIDWIESGISTREMCLDGLAIDVKSWVEHVVGRIGTACTELMLVGCGKKNWASGAGA